MISHKSMQVRCSIDEPMQLLMDKLASKSSDLYIFWQNYNQLYYSYNEKTIQIQRLQQENEQLRRQKSSPVSPPEEGFFKERYLYMEKSVTDFKTQLEKFRLENRDLKKENQRYHEENIQLQTLLQQLRDENVTQRSNIEKILIQLKNAQSEINSMAKVYEELGQKQMILSKYMANQKQLMDHITELESEIEEMSIQHHQAKMQYEKLIKQSMFNAKNKVMESIPGLLQTSKHKVQIINS